jgi:hypothetical protein
MPPMDSPIAPANKTMNIVSTLQKIIEEVKKPKSNKIIIIHYLKNIIKELIHYS